ncbi:MAG: hypothetical protein M1820_004111 [Bogoriella megaspora]|nr:MAG: hypothetical protein M1820_004111 [Bogoriella megaspora]
MLKPQPKLRLIFHLKEDSAPDEGVDIVVIPGAFVLYSKEACTWLKPLSWRDYSQEGFGDEVQLYKSYTVVDDVTCGMIFLGSPHITSVDDPRWDHLDMILKANRKDVSRHALTKDDIASLGRTCQAFEDIDLLRPILSVYEKQETKVRENLLHSLKGTNRKHILVDEGICRVRSKYEEVFAVDSVHNELAIVKVNGPLYHRLVDFFRHLAPFNKHRSDDRSREDSPPPEERTARLPTYLLTAVIRNKEFYGREHILQQIDAALLPSNEGLDKRLRSFAICGMGGIGKTELAIEFAFSRKDKFDAIFWVNADTDRKLATGFMDVSRVLGLEDSNTGYKEEVVTREIVKGWLSNPLKSSHDDEAEEAKWLLIFDNADDPDLLSDFWPVTGSGSILTTSRDPLAKEHPYEAEDGIDLPPMSNVEGGKLLQKISKRSQEQNSLEICSKISSTLGGLPLALTQMGRIIYRKHYGLDEFLDLFEENSKRLLTQKPLGRPLAYDHTVASVWAIEQLPDSARALLKVLSVLDSDRIQETILTEAAEDVDLENYPATKSDYADARYELIRASLVTSNTAEKQLRIHRLVQAVVREALGPDELKTVFESALILLSAVWPFTTFETRNQMYRWPIYDAYLPHAAKLSNLFRGKIESGTFKASVQAAALWDDAACSRKSRFWWERLEKRISRHLGDAHQYQSIAAQGTQNGELALKHCKAWVPLVVKRVERWNEPRDRTEMGVVYNCLGIAYMMLPDINEALKAWEASFHAFKDRDGSSILDTTWPALNLGIAWSQAGQPDKGESFIQPVVEYRDEKFGLNNTTTFENGASWRSLGHVRVAQGRFEEGLELHKRALANLRATYGPNHFQTADCCYNVAQGRLRLGETQPANELLDEAISGFGDQPWYVANKARALWRKGRLLRDTGRGLEAQGLLDEAMRIRHELAPEDKRSEKELDEDDWSKLIYWHSR